MKQFLESDDLLVGISELSKMTEVSPRQIRYWEQKGYIESTGEKSGNRKFRLPMVVRVEIIKEFLDEGFTLAAAVEKARERQENIHQTKKMFKESFRGIQTIDQRYVATRLEGFAEELLYLIRDKETDELVYHTLPEEEELTSEKIKTWYEAKKSEG